MPLFDYTGQLESGATFEGTLEAPGAAEAQALLMRMGVRVLGLRASRARSYVAPLSLEEFTFFNEQLAALTRAGLPLEAGLRQLAADVGSRRLKRLLLELAEDLAAGTPLAQALERQGRRFPAAYSGVVGAGLRTGDLGATLYGLTTHLRLRSGFRRTLLELLAYPLTVIVLTLLVASFVMRFVVPALAAIVEELAAEASGWGLRIPGWLTFTLAEHWPAVEMVIAVLAVVLLLALLLLGRVGGGALREAVVRRIPGYAQVYWSAVQARFVHASAIAAYTGTPVPELVAASGAASGSPALAAAARRLGDRLAQGADLAAAAAEEPDVPALWTCAVAVAGPRGDLAPALAELARAYEQRSQDWVSIVRAVLGPLLFLLLALVLGALIVGLFGCFAMLLRAIMSSLAYF